jgi:hypothetical protein
MNEVEKILFKKIKSNEGSTKVPTFVRESFYPKFSKWLKVSYQEKTK